MTGFVHLSVHSEFSLVDGIAKIPRLVQRAVDLDMPAIALTDRANLFGMVKFYQACCAQGVKPIVGMDLTYTNQVAGEINGNETFRCMVLAVSEAGYRNLLKLVSKAYTDSELRGTVRREWLFDAADGLLALSGGREGDIGRALVVSDQTRAEALAHDWTRAFGDRFYLEVQRIGLRDEHTDLANVVDLADALGLPLVATNDVRFLVPDDFEAHETRVCIQEGRTLNDPRRERRYSDQQYLRSVQEMEALFSDLPEALENTVEIAKRCSLSVDLGTYHLPNYPVRGDATIEEYFAERSAAGLEQRLDKLRRSTIDLDEQSYRDRLAFELNVINQMGFAGYFLIVTEFVNWAKDHDVPVGPGRGSGAGSLVAYSLGITGVDPLRYGLLFERLLNPERVSMPDFDIDFCMVGRDKVIAHVAEQYGHDAVSQIVTFGTMAAKAVVRDVARVQGKPYGLADRLSKMIPFEVGMTLTTAVAQEPLLREFIEQNEDVAEIMDMAYKLEGTVRNVGRHAGGVVIAPSALTDFVPLFAEESGGSGVSQFDKDDV
ncbi:MAG: DNA polymerase III subunit alpha, partial [Gammaproteobacteria bacterium]|nr:DNA polymerase III subunit alpha [Gammaproteobacteria bacterium]